MTELAKMLRHEQRRHVMMSVGLVAAAITAGTMVTNERGIFSTIGNGPMSALARAFAAIANDEHTPVLFRHNAANQPGGTFGDDPFDVLGAPADLRRRLMEALGGDGNPTTLASGPTPEILSQQITPDQIATNGTPTSLSQFGDGPALQTTGPSQFGAPTTGSPGPAIISDSLDAAPPLETPPVEAVPEPAMWALMIGGFGLIGAALRSVAGARRRRAFRLAE